MEDDVKKVEEIMDMFSEKGPDIIKKLLKTLYSKETGKSMGEAVAAFYNELTDAGIDKKVAVKMARDYLSSIKEMSPNMNKDNPTKDFKFNNYANSDSENEVD